MGETKSPTGTTENSPGIHPWDLRTKHRSVPAGYDRKFNFSTWLFLSCFQHCYTDESLSVNLGSSNLLDKRPDFVDNNEGREMSVLWCA